LDEKTGTVLEGKRGRSLKEKTVTVLKREKNIKKINPLNELTFKRVPRENLD
jgi:hypothetical protein